MIGHSPTPSPQSSPHPPSTRTAHIQQYLSAYQKCQPTDSRCPYQNQKELVALSFYVACLYTDKINSDIIRAELTTSKA